MTILGRIAARTFDAGIIAMLIFGDENMRTFALCVVALMVIVAWFAVFCLKPEQAKTMHARSFRLAIGIAINLAYTYALIVSDSPVWAAFYLLGLSAARMRAESIVAEEEKANATPSS